MKYIARILSLVLLVSAGIFYVSCNKDDDNKKSEQDQQIEKLVGTWHASSVKQNDVPNGSYGDFTLVISGSPGANSLSYTTSGRPATSPWNSSGSFTFGDQVVTKLNRDDNVSITYVVSGNALQMTFQDSPPYNARTSSVDGVWIFEFIK